MHNYVFLQLDSSDKKTIDTTSKSFTLTYFQLKDLDSQGYLLIVHKGILSTLVPPQKLVVPNESRLDP